MSILEFSAVVIALGSVGSVCFQAWVMRTQFKALKEHHHFDEQTKSLRDRIAQQAEELKTSALLLQRTIQERENWTANTLRAEKKLNTAHAALIASNHGNKDAAYAALQAAEGAPSPTVVGKPVAEVA